MRKSIFTIAAPVLSALLILNTEGFAQPCAEVLRMKSKGNERPITLTVKNNTKAERRFDWVNFNGERENYGRISPGETAKIKTFAGHPWVFADRNNICVEGFVPTGSRKEFTLTAAAPTEASSGKSVQRRFLPTSSYLERNINGFKLLIDPELVKNATLFADVIAELTGQTQRILKALPAKKIEPLNKVKIWVDLDADPDNVAIFYNSRQWLVDQGFNPDKAGSIGILDAKNFVNASRRNQPLVILHELAHAYQFKFADKLDRRISEAYKVALRGKTYESVEHSSGERRRAYAITSKDEYFAELTEAYFGVNDFFPFTRGELQKHDPTGYRLMESTWGP